MLQECLIKVNSSRYNISIKHEKLNGNNPPPWMMGLIENSGKAAEYDDRYLRKVEGYSGWNLLRMTSMPVQVETCIITNRVKKQSVLSNQTERLWKRKRKFFHQNFQFLYDNYWKMSCETILCKLSDIIHIYFFRVKVSEMNINIFLQNLLQVLHRNKWIWL